MKYLVVVGDGMADEPLEALGGRTPLEASRTPNMDAYARGGVLGRVRTIPEGMAPGSDVANMSLMGYPPERYFTGRAPLEAASMGIELGPEDIAFRCNLVTLGTSGQGALMLDYSGGGIDTGRARTYVETLNRAVAGTDHRFYPGVSYRHILVWKGARRVFEGLETTPPHDILGEPVEPYLPRGSGSDRLRDLMVRARSALSSLVSRGGEVPGPEGTANAIWLWGQGCFRRMPTLRERFGTRGAVISAVDLIKGLGRCVGLTPVEVPGATGDLDTNYQGKAYAALKALGEYDFAFLHVEAPDEASHRGNLEEKIDAIERLDEQVVGVIRRGLKKKGFPYRLLLLPDHPTPLRLRTHSGEPVPFLLYPADGVLGRVRTSKECIPPPCGFSEAEAERGGLFLPDATRLLDLLFGSDRYGPRP